MALETSEQPNLPEILQNPEHFTYSFLENITRGFSEENNIGNGGYGAVFQGCLPDGSIIAIKKFYKQDGSIDFFNEVKCMEKVKHENVVRLLGFCSEPRLLCMEYVGGNLCSFMEGRDHRIHDWSSCYKIIRGICFGLDHLHTEGIFHLDLKPENILLDSNNLVPKIADFGLSRLFGQQSVIQTLRTTGTFGYAAPEVVMNLRKVISRKTDVYSLGVIIIKLMTGAENQSSSETVYQQWISLDPWSRQKEDLYQKLCKQVIDKWDPILRASSCQRDDLYQQAREQVHACINIGLTCTYMNDPNARPTIWQIVDMLRTMDGSTQPTGVISVGPWGGDGGNPFHMHGGSAPTLVSITLSYSSNVIYSLTWWYKYADGRERSSGNWGGPQRWKEDPVRSETINLSDGEYVTAVKGTFGQYGADDPNKFVTSLGFITNIGNEYGPYGKQGSGTDFSVPVASGGYSIVGFWGRCGWFLDAIGVYIAPCPTQRCLSRDESTGSDETMEFP